MNRKAQSTVLFVILVPIILLVLAFIFDNGMLLVEKVRLKSTTKVIISELLSKSYTNYEEMAQELYEKNKIDTNMLVVEYENEVLTIYNSHSFTSVFGRLLGVRSYRVEINLQGKLVDEDVVITEVKND